MIHVHFGRSPLLALGAPVTEHVFAVPRDGVSLEELGAVLEYVCDTPPGKSDGVCLGTAWAKSEETPGELLFIAGWTTAEDHWKYISPGGPCHELAAAIKAKVDLEKSMVTHIPYMKHQWDDSTL